MAMTMNSAFNEFNRDYVNLDGDRTKIARGSRDWLMGQLNKFKSYTAYELLKSQPPAEPEA